MCVYLRVCVLVCVCLCMYVWLCVHMCMNSGKQAINQAEQVKIKDLKRHLTITCNAMICNSNCNFHKSNSSLPDNKISLINRASLYMGVFSEVFRVQTLPPNESVPVIKA